MFGLVCWPGEAGHCLHLFDCGTDVVLIVELVQSFFYLHLYACFVFYIHCLQWFVFCTACDLLVVLAMIQLCFGWYCGHVRLINLCIN